MKIAPSMARKAILEAAGVWHEFVALRAQREAEGFTKSEAYKDAAESFPISDKELKDKIAEMEALAPKPSAHVEHTVRVTPQAAMEVGVANGTEAAPEPAPEAKAPTKEDCCWVYQNIHNPEPDETSSPSTGAIGLHGQARVDHNVYKWVLDRISQKSFADESDGGIEGDSARTLTDIAKTLDKLTVIAEGVRTHVCAPQGDGPER